MKSILKKIHFCYRIQITSPLMTKLIIFLRKKKYIKNAGSARKRIRIHIIMKRIRNTGLQ